MTIPKIALFLGAGASACAGMPTTKELMKTMLEKHRDCIFGPLLDQYQDNDIENLYEDIEYFVKSEPNKIFERLPIICIKSRIADFIKENHSMKRRDVTEKNRKCGCSEHDIIDINLRYDQFFNNIFKPLDELKISIRNHIFDKINTSLKFKLKYEQPFKELLECVKNKEKPIPIITTNYDMLVEEYCSNNDIKVVDGFTRKSNSLHGIWSGLYYDDGFHINLIKLHGSLNWHKNEDGHIICENTIASHDSEQDIMIFPTPDKEEEMSQSPFKELFGRFKRVLEDTNLLVVIGVSFRDKEISKMIKDKADNGMHVICVSKNLDSLPTNKFKQLCIKNNRVIDVDKRANKKKDLPIYSFESEFNFERINDIIKVIHHVKTLILKSK